MSEKREFTGVFIPSNIWVSQELIPAEKMMLGEIDALSKNTGWCTASRAHFAEWLGCTVQNVSYYFEKLTNLGFLEIVKVPGKRSRCRVVLSRFHSLEGVSGTDGYPSMGLTGGVSGTDGWGKGDLPEIKDKEKEKNKYPDDFENAWKLYGHFKSSKDRAFTNFKKLKPEEKLRAVAAIPKHVAATSLTGQSVKGGAFKPIRCYFEKYLSEARWEGYESIPNQAPEPTNSAPTEFDQAYKLYLQWVELNSKNVLDMVAQLSKDEFIRFKKEDYPGTRLIGPGIQRRILLDAHKNFHNELPAATQHSKVWPYFLELIQLEQKSYQV